MSDIKKQIPTKFDITKFDSNDDLLEGISALEVIITLQANGIKPTFKEIEKVLNDIIFFRIQACKSTLRKNLKEIIKQIKEK